MKNKLNMLLSVTALLVLASCGGGGGDDSPTAKPAPAPAANTPAPVANTPAPENTNTNSTGATIGTTNDPSTIQINGQTVTIQFPGISSGGFTNLPGKIVNNGIENPTSHLIVSGNRYSYIQFGQVKMNSGDVHAFARGKGNGSLTTNMPTTGVVDYKGEAINNLVTGDATIKVNFADKSLTGKFDSTKADFGGDINLTATITGNQFKGDVNQAGKTATTNGAFFGPNAAEIGGKFNGNGLNGSFGAKK